MKKTYFAVIAAVALMLAGCETDISDPPTAADNPAPGGTFPEGGGSEASAAPAYLVVDGTTVTDIKDEYRETIETIIVPGGVTEIGQYAFAGCASLANVHIPAGVTDIGTGAFNGCSSLAEVTLPDGVRTVGEYAFSGLSLIPI